jgi:hypothetical protein
MMMKDSEQQAQIRQNAVRESKTWLHTDTLVNLWQQIFFVLGEREWHLVVDVNCGILIVGVRLTICNDPVTARQLTPTLLHLIR